MLGELLIAAHIVGEELQPGVPIPTVDGLVVGSDHVLRRYSTAPFVPGTGSGPPRPAARERLGRHCAAAVATGPTPSWRSNPSESKVDQLSTIFSSRMRRMSISVTMTARLVDAILGYRRAGPSGQPGRVQDFCSREVCSLIASRMMSFARSIIARYSSPVRKAKSGCGRPAIPQACCGVSSITL